VSHSWILADLQDTIADLLDIPIEHLEDDAYLASELDDDSLLDVALVVEDAHGIRFSEPELASFTCLSDVVACARRALQAERFVLIGAEPDSVHAM